MNDKTKNNDPREFFKPNGKKSKTKMDTDEIREYDDKKDYSAGDESSELTGEELVNLSKRNLEKK